MVIGQILACNGREFDASFKNAGRFTFLLDAVGAPLFFFLVLQAWRALYGGD